MSMKFQLLIKTNIPTNQKVSALILLDVALIMLINVNMPTIIDILTFMSRINFMLSRVEHKKFYILGARYVYFIASIELNFTY